MNKFSKRSKDNLKNVHPDLKKLFREVLKETDITILSGYRSPKEQNELYQQGRTTEGNVVTNVDGYNQKSYHNFKPSIAIDVAPYPIDWTDIERFKELSIVVRRIAKELNIDINWGGEWISFRDLPHYYLSLSYK